MGAYSDAAGYLLSNHVMTLATIGADGPAAAAVFYVNRDLTFYFLSSPRSLHAINLVAQPQISATIQADCDDWTKIRGVQLSGRARQIDGAERKLAERIYGEKFPGVLDGRRVPLAIAEALRRVCWYRFDVAHLRFIDNSRGFGHRDEWTAAAFLAIALSGDGA